MTDGAKKLRWGYSTGACAAALACSSWHYLQHGEILKEISLHFLDDQIKILPLLTPEMKNTAQFMRILKDGGDDPDCTHNAVLYGTIQESSLDHVERADYVLAVGHDKLIVRGIGGIGISTRLGLDCEQGHFAINTGPRQMITKNLELLGMGQDIPRVWLFSFGVVDGENIAKRSLNPLLGIEGGISILGTTGHVRPYSHDAYIETVRICVRSHHLNGGQHMVFCTGGRSQKAATMYYDYLPETAFVSIGDFIGESLKSAQKYEMREVSVACMAGKLCKYAAGFENTHAHNVDQDMELLREEIAQVIHKNSYLYGIDKDSASHNDTMQISGQIPDKMPEQMSDKKSFRDAEWKQARSVREALCYLPETLRQIVLDELAKKALNFFQHVYAHAHYRVLLCDFNGDIIFEKCTFDGTK